MRISDRHSSASNVSNSARTSLDFVLKDLLGVHEVVSLYNHFHPLNFGLSCFSIVANIVVILALAKMIKKTSSASSSPRNSTWARWPTSRPTSRPTSFTPPPSNPPTISSVFSILSSTVSSINQAQLHLVSLAVSDVCVGGVYFIGGCWRLSRPTTDWTSADEVDKDSITQLVVLWSLAVLTVLVNRYLTVYVAVKRARTVYSVAQALASLAASPLENLLEMFSVCLLAPLLGVCLRLSLSSVASPRTAWLVFFLLHVVVLNVLVVAAAVVIFARLRQRRRSDPFDCAVCCQFQRMTGAVAALFSASHAPMAAVAASKLIGGPGKDEWVFSVFCLLLNSSVNLFVYAAASPGFREALKEMVAGAWGVEGVVVDVVGPEKFRRKKFGREDLVERF